MKNLYDTIREKNQQKINEFPIKWAFSEEQFERAMKELGLTTKDADKIVGIGGGGFIRKTDVKEFNKLWDEIRDEHNRFIKQDKTGEGYIKDMFVSELNNHEYNYTQELDDTLEALELNYEYVMRNPALKRGLELALIEIKKDYEQDL